MPNKEAPKSVQGSFASGEISPSFAGSMDTELFFTSCRTLQNMLVTRSNGVSLRGGFNHKINLEALEDDGVLAVHYISLLIGNNQTEMWLLFTQNGDAGVIKLLDYNTFEVIHTYTISTNFNYETLRYTNVAYYENLFCFCRNSPKTEAGPLNTVFFVFWDDTTGEFEHSALSGMYASGFPWSGKTQVSIQGEQPYYIKIFQGRLIMVSNHWIYASEAGDIGSFDLGGSNVTNASGIKIEVANSDDDGFNWIQTGLFLMGGSDRGAWLLSDLQAGISPLYLNFKNYSGLGASDVEALYIDGYFFYFDSSERSPRIFTLNDIGPTSISLGEYAEHLFRGRKPISMKLQKSPESIVWILMDDGELIAFQHEPSTGKRAWSRHYIRGAVIEHIAISSDSLLAICNRSGYKYIAVVKNPFAEEWHETLDSFYLESQLPDSAYVASRIREDENDRMELTINGPIEDNKPYKVISSGGFLDDYYITEYAVDPATQPNEVKKLWLKTPDGEYVPGEVDDRVALDPRGVQISAIADSGGLLQLSVPGDYTDGGDREILIQFNDLVDEVFYTTVGIAYAVDVTTFTILTPLGQPVDYDSNIEVHGVVIFDGYREYTNAELANETLSIVTDRSSYDEIKADENGLFKQDAPTQAMMIGEEIEAKFEPRFFTDILGPRKGRVNHFYPYVINTPGFRYGLNDINDRTLEYDEVEAYTGPTEKCSLGLGGNEECTFYIYGSPGCRLEISHIFYEIEAI